MAASKAADISATELTLRAKRLSRASSLSVSTPWVSDFVPGRASHGCARRRTLGKVSKATADTVKVDGSRPPAQVAAFRA